jgi:serine/threonine protein phosphatase PrpC
MLLPPLIASNKTSSTELDSKGGPHNKSEALLPSTVTEEVASGQSPSELNATFNLWLRTRTEERDHSLKEAFRITNEKLDTATRIDCMMSGTTCVMLLLYRNMLICANAGDSRAVMFS